MTTKLSTVKQTADASVFNNTAFLMFTIRRWGNRKQADMTNVKFEDDVVKDAAVKKRVKGTKRLIVGEEIDAVVNYQNDLRKWVLNRCNPSFFRKGVYIAGLDIVEQIDDRLRLSLSTMKETLIPTLQEAFPRLKEKAKEDLNGQYREDDYPATDIIPNLYGIEWGWIQFDVPKRLPEEIRMEEEKKIKKRFEEAGQQIIDALRWSFRELISHATERLTVAGNEKPKIFRDSLVENFKEFCDTFQSRNIFNDAELAKLVVKAQEVVQGVDAETLRENLDVRKVAADKLDKINRTLQSMAIEKPTRKFDLEEED